MGNRLNQAKQVGVVGCFTALSVIFLLSRMMEYGKSIEYSELGVYYWSLLSIELLGLLFLISFPLITVGLFSVTLLQGKQSHKLAFLLSGFISLAATILTALWVIPYSLTFFKSIHSDSLQLTLEELANMELLWSQSSFLAILSLFFAGLAGIAGRESDRVSLAGYIITFSGGLAALITAVTGSTSLLPGLGGVDWIPPAFTISLISYVGLIPVFCRPVIKLQHEGATTEVIEDFKNSGYTVAAISGLILLFVGLATNGLQYRPYYDLEWLLLRYIMTLLGFVSLGMALFRPVRIRSQFSETDTNVQEKT